MKSLLLTLVLTAAGTVASAQLVNPSFETGDFTGWTVSGEAASVFSIDDVITSIVPFDGAFYAALQPDTSIVQAVGIHLHAGETVSAWMDGTTSFGGSLDLVPNSGPAIHVEWTPSFEPGSTFPVRWKRVWFKIQHDGIYSIGASHFSASPDSGGPTFFGVDLFTITPVPEPSSYGLLAAVLGVAAIVWRRRKASAAAAT